MEAPDKIGAMIEALRRVGDIASQALSDIEAEMGQFHTPRPQPVAPAAAPAQMELDHMADAMQYAMLADADTAALDAAPPAEPDPDARSAIRALDRARQSGKIKEHHIAAYRRSIGATAREPMQADDILKLLGMANSGRLERLLDDHKTP